MTDTQDDGQRARPQPAKGSETGRAGRAAALQSTSDAKIAVTRRGRGVPG